MKNASPLKQRSVFLLVHVNFAVGELEFLHPGGIYLAH